MIRIKKNNPFLISLAVAVLLLFLHLVGLLGGLENLFASAVRPLSSRLYGWSASLSSSYQSNKDAAGLNAEIESLRHQVAGLTVANSNLQETEEENEKLRSALKFQEESRLQMVTASIIAKEEAGQDNRDLVIDRGSQDGVRSGLGVISEEGMIVGKVVETKDRTALICLVTSPNCRLAAAVQNQNKTQGLTDGDLGLTIKMSYIPQLEKIAGGDLVMTSGLDGEIPRGLVIGRVAQVKNESNEVWQEATIEPVLNFNNLTVVSVIIP
mgnify:CR=1 FL=1